MFRSFFISFIILSLFISSQCYGQSYQYKNYTVDDGLPSSEVFHVMQDSKGYIWIATNQGVSRYNGYEFQNFDIQDGLPENTILELFEDYKGRIWFISLLGKLSFFESDSIHKYKYNDILNQKGFYKNHLMKKSFFVDSLDQIYIGFYRGGLIKIDNRGKLSRIESNYEKETTVLKRMSERDLVFNYKDITSSLELNNQDTTLFVDIYEKVIGSFRTLAIYSKGYFLHSRKNRLFIFDSIGNYKTKTFENEIIWMSEDSKGLIWLGFLGGGIEAYSHKEFDIKEFHVLKDKSVSSVCLDSEDAYWFSTLGNGLYYFPGIEIKSLTKDEGLDVSFVSKVEVFNNELWFGGDSETLYAYNFKDLKSHQFTFGKRLECKLLKALNDTLVLGFVGKTSEKVFLINSKLKVVDKFNFNTREAIKLGSSVLFFNRHVNRYNRKLFKEELRIISEYTRIHTVLLFNDNSLWLGTDNGLYEYELGTAKSTKIEFNALLKNRINYLLKDDDVVWIGTKGAGLLKYTSDSIFQYTKSNGLPGNSVNAIEKKDSILWLATNNGVAKFFINKYEVESNEIEVFSKANGMLGVETFDIALFSDYVFVGTNRGVSYFKENLSGINKTAPSIYFTQVKVLNRDTIIQNHYELEYNQNYIDVSFTGLSYQRENDLQYMYMLEGVNKDWIFSENRSVTYPMLPPGDYIFKVKVINRSDVESEIKSISFKINKAYYQTIWFKISLIIIILLIISLTVGFIFFTKMKEVKKRNQVINELNKYRQQALSAQMNPHFMYNSLNSVQSYILQNDILKSCEHLSKFSSLMRKVLENSQNSLITLQEEFDALNLYVEMELIRFKKGFDYSLDIMDGVDLNKYDIPPLILQPFIENAIHHGLRNKEGDKRLKIEVKENAGRIFIFIEDNGIGREEAQKIKQNELHTYESYGMEITAKRIDLIKESDNIKLKHKIIDLKTENGDSMGTRIEIEIY